MRRILIRFLSITIVATTVAGTATTCSVAAATASPAVHSAP
jgi:hypothetical protein